MNIFKFSPLKRLVKLDNSHEHSSKFFLTFLNTLFPQYYHPVEHKQYQEKLNALRYQSHNGDETFEIEINSAGKRSIFQWFFSLLVYETNIMNSNDSTFLTISAQKISTPDGVIDEVFDISSDDDDEDLYEFYEIGSDSDESMMNSPVFAGFHPLDDKSLIAKIEPMDANEPNATDPNNAIHLNGQVLLGNGAGIMQPDFGNTSVNEAFDETLPFPIENPKEIEADTTSKQTHSDSFFQFFSSKLQCTKYIMVHILAGRMSRTPLSSINRIGINRSRINRNASGSQAVGYSTNFTNTANHNQRVSQSELDDSLINLVVDQILPFSFVESQAFQAYTNREFIFVYRFDSISIHSTLFNQTSPSFHF